LSARFSAASGRINPGADSGVGIQRKNGAVLIVLWNAIVLHARWGGLVKERGLMALCIVGNIITAWSWFGTNELGIGLHAYGFHRRRCAAAAGVSGW